MNAPIQIAEFTRHRFTVDDARALGAAGVFEKNARIELIDGELIDMPPESPLNVDWSIALGRWLARSLSDDYAIVPGLSLVLSEWNAPKPDWWVFPAALETEAVRGPDVLLAIEQSDTSLSRDLGWKADLYAQFGLSDYWVIDLKDRSVVVHRDPSPEGYRTKRRYGSEDDVPALLIPGLVLTIPALTRVS